MITRRTALALLGTTVIAGAWRIASAAAEPDFLKARIAEGKLAPVTERLPKTPRVIDLASIGRAPGTHGGTVRMIIGGPRDIRLMPIYGYARLVGYDERLNMQADILESYEVVEERIFTLRLREGHKWSDGSAFTSEDFRYCWEDVFLEKEINKGGIPVDLRVDGKGPIFEVLDERTLRYSWEKPNPDFLTKLAAPSPLRIMMPSAYLRQFHKKYQDADTLAKLIKQNRVEDWSALHMKMSRTVRPENPGLPSLDPWCNTTEPPAEQFLFDRNPFFHRVDENGTQLPYIDRFVLSVSSGDIIAAKTGSGESDLQFAGIDFTDYTFLKEAEKRYALKVNLWKRTQGSRIALMPNLNCNDPVWRMLFCDVRVRRALSLAIDRDEINKAVFYGLAQPGADTILPDSPLFKPEYAQAYASYDPDRANAMLDEAGLAPRNENGLRRLPDGRLFKIIVESAGENTFETDVLELVRDQWSRVGVAVYVRVSQRDIFRSRAKGGDIAMSVWQGLDNGVPTPQMSPAGLAPTFDDQMQWPVWGTHYLSGGKDGHPPDLPVAIELLDLFKQWRSSATDAQRTEIWRRMLEIHADQVLTIGIVNGALQPVVRAARLRNVPDKGLYGFDPTAYLGVYMPDTFWYEGGR